MDENSDEIVFGPWEFTEELAEQLERTLQLVKVARRRLELQFNWRGRPVLVELENFYHIYRRQPQRLDSIIQAVLESVRSQMPQRGAVSFEQIKERIYPMLKPNAILAEVSEQGLPMLAYRLFLADLAQLYVIDEDRSFAYINEEHLLVWGISEEQLYQTALDNLRRLTLKPDMCTVIGEDERSLMIYSAGDGYDATRLLLTDLLQEWQERIPGRLVIGIPHRDVLVGFSDADPSILRRIAMQIAKDMTHAEYGLTDQLFTVVDGRLELYEYDLTSSEKF